MKEVSKDSIRNAPFPQELIDFVIGYIPTHTAKETQDAVSEMFGRTICTRSITNIVSKYHVKRDEKFILETHRRLWRNNFDSMLAAKRTPESKNKRSSTVKKIYEKEKWREERGLERKTNLNIVLNRKLTERRSSIKYKLTSRHNYFPDEDDQRTLYYDEQTRRSAWMENKYKAMFNFYPADGFNEADSVWCKKYKNL